MRVKCTVYTYWYTWARLGTPKHSCSGQDSATTNCNATPSTDNTLRLCDLGFTARLLYDVYAVSDSSLQQWGPRSQSLSSSRASSASLRRRISRLTTPTGREYVVQERMH